MSVVAAVSTADNFAMRDYAVAMRALSEELLPAAQQGNAIVNVASDQRTMTASFGDDSLIRRQGASLFVGIADGAMPEAAADRRSNVPDGSYLTVRCDRDGIEVCTDFSGSRSAWYAILPCNGVVVSTSLEVIIALLGKLELDETAVGWFLSAGTTGPDRSWDQRIKPIPRNTRFRATLRQARPQIDMATAAAYEHYAKELDDDTVASVLQECFASLKPGGESWLLALSGGYDSRALLQGFRDLAGLSCITWADAEHLAHPANDVAIAGRLSVGAGIGHSVRVVDRPATPAAFEAAARRFMRYGDGRTDNIAGYVDGMRMWDEVAASGVAGILRGDELFGSNPGRRVERVLHNMRLSSFADYASGPVQRQLAERFEHRVPEYYLRLPGESYVRWRWRLRVEFEIPTVYASLNAIRNRFTESVCPLLMRRVVSLAHAMPDASLDGKRQFKRVVAKADPGVPFARSHALLSRRELMALPPVVESLSEHLSGDFARHTLGVETMVWCRKALHRGASSRMAERLRRRLGREPQISGVTLALRSYLASLAIEEFTSLAARTTRLRRERHVESA